MSPPVSLVGNHPVLRIRELETSIVTHMFNVTLWEFVHIATGSIVSWLSNTTDPGVLLYGPHETPIWIANEIRLKKAKGVTSLKWSCRLCYFECGVNQRYQLTRLRQPTRKDSRFLVEFLLEIANWLSGENHKVVSILVERHLIENHWVLFDGLVGWKMVFNLAIQWL